MSDINMSDASAISSESHSFNIPIPEADTNLQFTFGVELEFYHIENPQIAKEAGIEEKHRDINLGLETGPDDLLEELMAKHLTDSGIKAKTWFPHNGDGQKPDYSTWTVTFETLQHPTEGVMSPSEYGQRWENEVISRILTLPEALREIPIVLEALTSKFDILVSATCGTHIHVGRQPFWPVEFLRKLATIILIFEEQMDGLHDVTRIGNANCAPNRDLTSSRLEASIQLSEKAFDQVTNYFFSEFSRTENWTDDADNVQIMALLLKSVGCTKFTKVNFANFLRSWPSPTIEFRQHVGTLDAEDILMWIQFINHLLRWIESQNLAGIMQLISEKRHKSDFNTVDFLIAINTPVRIVEYYREFSEAQFVENRKRSRAIQLDQWEDLNKLNPRNPLPSRPDTSKYSPAEVRFQVFDCDAALRQIVSTNLKYQRTL